MDKISYSSSEEEDELGTRKEGKTDPICWKIDAFPLSSDDSNSENDEDVKSLKESNEAGLLSADVLLSTVEMPSYIKRHINESFRTEENSLKKKAQKTISARPIINSQIKTTIESSDGPVDVGKFTQTKTVGKKKYENVKGSTSAKEKVKRQRVNGQSGIGESFKEWRSEDEMRLRQHYDS